MNHDWWLLLGPVGGFFNYLKPPDLRGQPHPLRRFSPPKGRLKDIIQEQHGIAEDRQLLCYKGTLGGLDGAIFADLKLPNTQSRAQLGPIFFVKFQMQPTMEFSGANSPKAFQRGVFAFFSPILTVSSWKFQLWQLVTSMFEAASELEKICRQSAMFKKGQNRTNIVFLS